MFKKSNSNKIDFKVVYEEVKEDLKDVYESIPVVKKHKERKKIERLFLIMRYVILGLALLFFVVIIFNVRNINIVYTSTRDGKDNLEQLKFFVEQKNFNLAHDYAVLAQENFEKASSVAEKYNNYFIIKKIRFFSGHINDVYYLLLGLKSLSEAVVVGTDFGIELSNVLKNDKDFIKLTQEEKREVLRILTDGADDFEKISAKINEANDSLQKVQVFGFLKIFEDKITDSRNKINEASGLVTTIAPMIRILPSILGYPSKSAFLVALQNNDELRPTGGFIGTYGILEMENSDFVKMDTHDVYHLDMPVKDLIKIEPPDPLKKYLGIKHWYLRDSNWSPDWNESAKKIEEFYLLEDDLLPEKNQINKFSGNFSGIIGLTPDVIVDLLKFLGPVVVDGEEYNSENFTKLLEYRVEKGYYLLGEPSWHRKEVIGDIAKALKERILDLNFSQMYSVIGIVDKNLKEKNILFYFKDDNLKKVAQKQNWDGGIYKGADDFLMVVDANMASLKTDAVVDRAIDYKIKELENVLVSELKLSYKHKGGFDWRTTRYRSYTRVYVPKGSRLVQIGGIDKKDVKVYDEFDKTVFAFFLSVEPGKVGDFYFKYSLPNSLYRQLLNENTYKLYLQKQPGNYYDSLNVEAELKNDLEDYLPLGLYVSREVDNKIKWETEYDTDLQFFIRTTK